MRNRGGIWPRPLPGCWPWQAAAAARQRPDPTGSRAGQPVRGGNLVIDIATPQQDFDVNTTSDNESIWTYDQVAQTLYINGPDGKSLGAWAGDQLHLSPDKLNVDVPVSGTA